MPLSGSFRPGELPGRVLSGIVSVPASVELESESYRGPEPHLDAGIDVQSLFLLTARAGEDTCTAATSFATGSGTPTGSGSRSDGWLYFRRGGDRRGRGRTTGEHNLMVRWIKHLIICSPQSGLFLLYLALCPSSSPPSTQYSRFLAGCPPNCCFLNGPPDPFLFQWRRGQDHQDPGPNSMWWPGTSLRFFFSLNSFSFCFAPRFILLLIFIALGGLGFWRVVRWPSHDIPVDVTTPPSHNIFDGVAW